MVSWRADEATPEGVLRLMSVENLSTGIEASATVESLNSGDPAVYRAARYSFHRGSSWSISKITPKVCFRVPFYISNELSPQYMRF